MYHAERHFAEMYRSVDSAFAFRAETRREFLAWQRRFRPRLRETLGLDAMAADLAKHTPKAVRREVADCGEYMRELWNLSVEPTVPLPFYLLRPKGAVGRLPLVLTPHGHNSPGMYVGLARNAEERRIIRDEDGDIAVQAVREGYLVIAPTTRGFGDSRTEDDRKKGVLISCRLLELHGLLAGRCAVGERVWDLERILDWALAHLGEEIDTRRIAITGHSAGGMASLFAAACDTRIGVAVSACYFSSFQGSIGSIYHCECNYIPGILRLGEMADIAGLIASRPFLAINGKDDLIFPIKDARRSYRELKQIYEVAGAPESCGLRVGEYGHRYEKAAAWPFIQRAFAAIA